MSTLSIATPPPAPSIREKLTSIHPLLILPVIGAAAWLAADAFPGSGASTAPAQAERADSATSAPAAQGFSDNIPSQMPATLFPAPAASSAGPVAYTSLGDGGVGSAGGSSGGGSGSGGTGSGQSKQHERRSGRVSATDASAHVYAGYAHQGFPRVPQRAASPIQQATLRPLLPSRGAPTASMAPRPTPAPRMVYRPVPFRSFGGGGFHYMGGHFGGGRR